MKTGVRQKINIIIDIIMLIVMILVATIGISIRYILISGEERWIKYGQNMKLSIWGLDRHEWGRIHLLTGIFLIALLVLHLYFHWAQIVSMLKKLMPGKVFRTLVLGGVSVVVFLLALLPFIIPLEFGDPIYGKGKGQIKYENENQQQLVYGKNTGQGKSEEHVVSTKEKSVNESNEEGLNLPEPRERIHNEHEDHVLEIRGFYTISEVANKFGVSSYELKTLLNIPQSINNNERLGRLRRTHNFTMSDVERAVLKLQSE